MCLPFDGIGIEIELTALKRRMRDEGSIRLNCVDTEYCDVDMEGESLSMQFSFSFFNSMQ